MTADQAKINLQFVNKKSAPLLHNLVKSGIAAAKENYFEPNQVVIKSIYCNEGPRLKRIIPWSKGQARRITKRLSHIVLTLESVEEPLKKTEAKKSEDIKSNNKDKKAE